MIVSFVVFSAYVVFIWLRYGVQKSISDSYYRLRGSDKILFTLFCWGFAMPFIISSIEIHSLFFFSGAGICFVGAAAAFKDSVNARNVHMIGAYSGVALGFIGLGLIGLFLPIGIFLLSGIFLIKTKNNIWWIEISAFLIIIVSLWLYQNT